ncbi:Protein OPI10 [Hypsizygus marmoreus]|uniref:Protein OPI10 n=1 Tax=Hypsizygus marmoreus TaxID=39966 RepID=A0A369K8H1_HYPMA|nr:Protein OPI10 [Hypsizygus marmoreus]
MLASELIWDETLAIYRLSNEKPSAIFRLRGNFIQASSSTRDTAFSSASSGMQQDNDVTAVLGLAIEPLQQVQAEIARLPSAVAKPAHPDPTVLAERIVKNLFNYVSGFVGGTGGVTPELAVPMRLIIRWYEMFINKVRVGGIGFLERGE